MTDSLSALERLHDAEVEIDAFRRCPVVFRDRLQALRYAYDLSSPSMAALEFGVFRGASILALAAHAPSRRITGFDSFEGLPEPWSRSESSTYPAGHFRVSDLPPAPPNVAYVKGFFSHTLGPWLAANQDPAGFVHIDCDLGSSTAQVLEALTPRFRADAVIVFDELCDWRDGGVYPNWPDGEWRALKDWLAATGWRFRILCRDDAYSAAIQLAPPPGEGEASGPDFTAAALPDSTHLHRARLLERFGEGAAGAELAGALGARRPGLAVVWQARLELLRRVAGPAAARAELETAETAATGPGATGLTAPLALAFAQTLDACGETEAAIRHARRAIELDGASADAFACLATLLSKKRDFEGALAAWERSALIRPSVGATRRHQDLKLQAAMRPEFRQVAFAGLILQEIVDRFDFSTVIDIGSGSGDQARLLRSLGKQVLEVDYGDSVYFEKNRNPDEVLIGDFVTMDLAGRSFDCAIASHVLEHQPNVQAFLAKLASVVRESGVIAITVPPAKSAIVGGHLTLWNAGLLLYNMVVAGIDCREAIVRRYGYNISVAVRHRPVGPLALAYDSGDIDRISAFLPPGLSEGFDGDIVELNPPQRDPESTLSGRQPTRNHKILDERQRNMEPAPAANTLREGAETCRALSLYKLAGAVKGFMNADDALHFDLALGMQRALGVAGDIMEIGSWFGKSAGFLANYVEPGEQLLICDAFQSATVDKYDSQPSVADLETSIRTIAPDFDFDRLVVHSCLSNALELPPETQLRFAHVDGGHSEQEALHDLRLVAEFMVEGGVIVVDDFRHKNWPEVVRAVEIFLETDPRFDLAAGLNRWIALGQKAYLVRRPERRDKRVSG